MTPVGIYTNQTKYTKIILKKKKKKVTVEVKIKNYSKVIPNPASTAVTA